MQTQKLGHFITFDKNKPNLTNLNLRLITRVP
jgi:hypothetical protein